MVEEKHDAGFKVVDRRSFSSETSSATAPSDTAPGPSPAAAEPPEAERSSGRLADESRGATNPQIEIPGDNEDFGLDTGAQAATGFETLVSYLGTTTMFQLGLMAGPSGERIPSDLRNARQTIDMLEVLQEKTQGNLNTDEVQLLDDVLYELRMAYIEVEKRARAK
jgi:hypothetical protein